MSVSATSIPITGTKKEMIEITETGKTAKAVETAKVAKTTWASKKDKESKGDENLRLNLT